MCNERVYYYKNKKTYYIDWVHSNYCNEIIRKVYNNIADINEEVNNYKEFRESIENYLDKYPLIKYSKFILKANKLYYKKNCNFDIKENTLKNIYYNWRKKSMAYTKFYAFNNNLCKNKKVFLKEYRNLYLYKSNGKKQFNHEHFIFCSDFFINELNKSEHWYIDATFIYPPGFKELIVILYIDKDTNKRFPGMFILTNNKHFEGYNLIFGSVKRILTIENSKKLNLKTYCTDYKKSLIKAFSLNFKEARGVGCYYHFCENIYKNAKKFGIVAKNNCLDYEFLNLYYKLPFKISNDKNILDDIKNKYTNIKPKNISEKYLTFINYFDKQWLEYLDNGYINYFNLKKEYRSNSYLENYNRNIKLKLSDYLLGKNQCKLNWPLIIQFLRNEEEFYRLKKFEINSNLVVKENDYKNEIENDISNINFISNNNIKFFKWHENSCRYDTFFFLFYYLIKPYLENYCNIINNSNILNTLINFSVDCVNELKKNENTNIWNMIKKHKHQYLI